MLTRLQRLLTRLLAPLLLKLTQAAAARGRLPRVGLALLALTTPAAPPREGHEEASTSPEEDATTTRDWTTRPNAIPAGHEPTLGELEEIAERTLMHRRDVRPTWAGLLEYAPPDDARRVRQCGRALLRFTHPTQPLDLISVWRCWNYWCFWCPVTEQQRRAAFQAAKLRSVNCCMCESLSLGTRTRYRFPASTGRRAHPHRTDGTAEGPPATPVLRAPIHPCLGLGKARSTREEPPAREARPVNVRLLWIRGALAVEGAFPVVTALMLALVVLLDG